MTQRNIHLQAFKTPSNDVAATRLHALALPISNVALVAALLLVLVLIITGQTGAGVGFV